MNHPPADLANTDERAIDQTLAQWVLGRTGFALLASAARMASTAEGQGHSCAWLSDPQTTAAFDDAALAALRQHEWVGDGSRFTPFVLDARNRFYLWRNWRHESKIAEAILRRCSQRMLSLPSAALAADLDRLFPDSPIDPSRWQRDAVAMVPGSRFFVLTGGPGTGKTTTVVRMLLMLLRHAEACGLPARPAIALAAPTGKAAQRLAQAVAKGKVELQMSMPADPAGSALTALLPLIPQTDARTLHRLLGYRPSSNTFDLGPHNPLPEDIVVVDEASMIDLGMMRQLLQALRPEALLILLGDPGQLASVDAGSVLSDIVASAMTEIARHPTPPHVIDAGAASGTQLSDHVVTLAHSWRAGDGLQHGVESLRHAPDPRWLDALVAGRSDGDLHLQRCTDNDDLRVNVDRWIAGHADLLGNMLSPGITAGAALTLMHQLQILCALRDGPFGAHGINALFERRLAVRFDIDVRHTWYHGRPVIITRNDYARGLFNGDVGIALEGTGGLRVWFEPNNRQGVADLRSFSPRALPVHESAWAITVHRSQGSEYRDVAVVLPPDLEQRVLTRELVYTGVSRARHCAEVWCTDAVLRASLARPLHRQGGLQDRLGET